MKANGKDKCGTLVAKCDKNDFRCLYFIHLFRSSFGPSTRYLFMHPQLSIGPHSTVETAFSGVTNIAASYTSEPNGTTPGSSSTNSRLKCYAMGMWLPRTKDIRFIQIKKVRRTK